MKAALAAALLLALGACAEAPRFGPDSVRVTRDPREVVRCELQGYLEPTLSAAGASRYDPVRDMRARAWQVHRADTLLVTSRHGKLWGATYRCGSPDTPPPVVAGAQPNG